MKRPVQVYFEAGELERLEAWSRARGWNKSQAVRAAVRALTGAGDADPLLDVRGMVHGLPSDLSQDFDRYLDATFVAEPSPRYRTRARRTRATVRR